MYINTYGIDDSIMDEIGELIIKKLLEACKNGDVHIFKNILENTDININKLYEYGDYFDDCEFGHNEEFTLLMLAVVCSQTDIVEFLLINNNIDINAVENHNNPALILSCYDNVPFEIAKKLIDHNKINLNLKCENGITMLMEACNKNRLDIVNELLRWSDTDVFIKDNDGHMAIYHTENENISKIIKDEMMPHFDFLPVSDDILRLIMEFY